MALKMVKLVDRSERTMREQLKLTVRRRTFAARTLTLIFKSRLFSLAVFTSSFSNLTSSRNVGLNGFSVLAVPGVLRALFKGEAGVIG